MKRSGVFKRMHQLIVLLTYGVLPARENGTMYRHQVEIGLGTFNEKQHPTKSFEMSI